MKNIILLFIILLLTITSFGHNNPIYLDSNGVTIKCRDDIKIGTKSVVNDIEYTVVSEKQLRRMIKKGKDVSKVCTSKITNMSTMCGGAFSGDISSWDVSNVTDMSWMFTGSCFNGDISKWDVSNVTDMNMMFALSKFDNDISSWDVSNVSDMSWMFNYSLFNNDMSNWDVSNVKSMSHMFWQSKFNGDISNWDVSSVTDMSLMFCNAQFNRDISDWNISKVTNYEEFSGSNSKDEYKPKFK